jgi:hypothetical protein
VVTWALVALEVSVTVPPMTVLAFSVIDVALVSSWGSSGMLMLLVPMPLPLSPPASSRAVSVTFPAV